jgi:hypothetical protein
MGPPDLHRIAVGPFVAGGQRHLDVGVGVVLAVAEPIVVLELDPAGREHVEGGGRLEEVAMQEAVGDLARVRIEPLLGGLGRGGGRVDVAPEAGADLAHLRIGRVLKRAVVCAVLRQLLERHGAATVALLGVVEVELAHVVAVRPQVEQRHGRGQLPPLAGPVHALEDRRVDAGERALDRAHHIHLKPSPRVR